MAPPSDPIMNTATLMPLSGTPSGVVVPRPHVPGAVRPWCARLAVEPIEAGRHDTTSTRETTQQATQESRDGTVVPDSHTDLNTDT